MEIIVLAALYVIVNAVIDAWAVLRGQDSPRMARRRAQHLLAQDYQRDTGKPTIWRAICGRVAERIAAPRGPGAFRRFSGEVWHDSWVDAADWHRARRARRAQAPAPTQAVTWRLCKGECGRFVAQPWTHCSGCERARASRSPEPTDYQENIEDADVVDADTQPIPVVPPQPPGPTPTPEPHRKDTPPVSTTTINGDTVSPLENLGFATGCMDLNTAIGVELDTIGNNLRGAGVGPGLVQTVADVKAAAEQFGGGAEGARDAYAIHVHHQAEIAGDVELRDTVANTYLDTARV